MLRPSKAGWAGPASPAGKPDPVGSPTPYAPGERGREGNAQLRADQPSVLDALGVQYVILDLKSDSDLHRFMQAQPCWFIDFEDGEGAVFARANG
jgi:hypothetical protein